MPAVNANTGTKVIFTVDDPEQYLKIIARSGEVEARDGTPLGPRLSKEELNAVSSIPGAFLLTVRGSGSPAVSRDYFTPGTIIYPFAKADYDSHEGAALPDSGVRYPQRRSRLKALPAEQPDTRAAGTRRSSPPDKGDTAELVHIEQLVSTIRDRLGLTQVVRP